MLPKTHILLGLAASLILWAVFPLSIGWFGALIIFLSSFLIDVDHYIYYALKKKDFSLRRAYAWFIQGSKAWRALSPEQKRQYRYGVIIFHGIECILILLLLCFLHKIFLFVLIGFLIHLALDFVDLFRHHVPLYVKSSQIYTYLTGRNKPELQIE